MSFADIREAVAARFRTQVAVPQSLPVVQANQQPPAIAQRWCQMTVEFQNVQQVSTGGATQRRYRISGRIALNLFEKVGAGDGSMLTLMDAITAAFRGVALPSPMITFGAPTLLGVSVRDEAGAHWRMPAQVPFRADVMGE